MNVGHVYREGVGVLVHRSTGNVISDNEIAHLGYTAVSLGWEWGYAEPSGAGDNVVARNFIHHVGRWELCDLGGVYVLGRSPGTRIVDNVIAWVAAYHMYAWGVYLDEGATGVHVEGNLVHHTLAAGLHLHFGFENVIRGNIFACAGRADGELAISIGEPHRSFTFERNVVLRCEDWAEANWTAGEGDAMETEEGLAEAIGVAVGAQGEIRARDRGAIVPDGGRRGDVVRYPLDPGYVLWWKGEGSTSPNVTSRDNIYWSLVPGEGEQAPGLLPPPSLFWVKRGRSLAAWQGMGNELGSVWADPGLTGARQCDFTLEPASAAAVRDVGSLLIPSTALGQPGGGDASGAGCGGPAWPGRPWPRPAPVKPLSQPSLSLSELAALIPDDGPRLLREHAQMLARAEEQQAQQAEALLALRRFAAANHQQHGMACWAARASLGRPGRYLPECTADGCYDHGSLELAVAVCDALGDSCGGVTVDEASSTYQTRAGRRFRRGPPAETSFLKRRCDGGVGGRADHDSAPDFENPCVVCRAIMHDVLHEIGSRRRSEAEVIAALESTCARVSAAKNHAHDQVHQVRMACDVLLDKHGEALETALQRPGDDGTICSTIMAECRTSL